MSSEKNVKQIEGNPNIESEIYFEIINQKRIFYSETNENFYSKITFALEKFNDFIKEKENNSDSIYISFNGGKDCLAAYILIKFYFFCKEKSFSFNEINSFNEFKTFKYPLQNSKMFKFVYFINEKNYEEEEIYVKKFAEKENIELVLFKEDYISGMNYLILKENLKSIIMGTRADDLKNYSNKETLIHPSTSPYPIFIRFYPVFHFDFEDIWRLILHTNFDYLDLYNKGYSSIGNKFNTKLNENLKVEFPNENGGKLIYYLPAFCLEQKNNNSEREFRENLKN